jgi:hypothetical protein
LVRQIANGETGGYDVLENAVLDVLIKRIPAGEKVSTRTIIEKGNRLIRSAGSPKIRMVLEELHGTEVLSKEGKGKTALYWIDTHPRKGVDEDNIQ